MTTYIGYITIATIAYGIFLLVNYLYTQITAYRQKQQKIQSMQDRVAELKQLVSTLKHHQDRLRSDNGMCILYIT